MENQRSLVWATMTTQALHDELGRLTRRMRDAVERGEPYDARTWREWSEEILLELQLRADEDQPPWDQDDPPHRPMRVA